MDFEHKEIPAPKPTSVPKHSGMHYSEQGEYFNESRDDVGNLIPEGTHSPKSSGMHYAKNSYSHSDK